MEDRGILGRVVAYILAVGLMPPVVGPNMALSR